MSSSGVISLIGAVYDVVVDVNLNLNATLDVDVDVIRSSS
jgi:hypothetical protein